jgi:hypothetical protein
MVPAALALVAMVRRSMLKKAEQASRSMTRKTNQIGG